jgi:hypothetical protein
MNAKDPGSFDRTLCKKMAGVTYELESKSYSEVVKGIF